MGEYARYCGDRIKIGTCEDMYYLRADQAGLVTAEYGNVDPMGARERETIRFRFPFPDEDDVAPGMFDDPFRTIGLYGVTVPEGVEHGSVQFLSNYPRKGMNVSLPCPDGPSALPGVTIHRNGYAGPVHIVQQGYRNGVLALIAECGSCGAKYNLPTFTDVEPVLVALRAEADRATRDESPSRADWYRTIADRIEAGYRVAVTA